MKSIVEFISLVTLWDDEDRVYHRMDPQVDGVTLIVNQTREEAIIAYLNEDDFEEVDYSEAITKYPDK